MGGGPSVDFWVGTGVRPWPQPRRGAASRRCSRWRSAAPALPIRPSGGHTDSEGRALEDGRPSRLVPLCAVSAWSGACSEGALAAALLNVGERIARWLEGPLAAARQTSDNGALSVRHDDRSRFDPAGVRTRWLPAPQSFSARRRRTDDALATKGSRSPFPPDVGGRRTLAA